MGPRHHIAQATVRAKAQHANEALALFLQDYIGVDPARKPFLVAVKQEFPGFRDVLMGLPNDVFGDVGVLGILGEDGFGVLRAGGAEMKAWGFEAFRGVHGAGLRRSGRKNNRIRIVVHFTNEKAL
jgi:hypothetical protein